MKSKTYLNILFRHPNPNNTIPVTTHAATNSASSPSDGNNAGIKTYPSMGRDPKVAKERNMTTPSFMLSVL
jgi:hypothetical protein